MSSNNKKKPKESLASKIAIVTGLGIVLIVGLVAIGVFLFSDLLSNISYAGGMKPYEGNNIYEGITVRDWESADKMTAEYTGGTLYAGGWANPDDFVVTVHYKDGTSEEIKAYTSNIQKEDFRLEQGSNSIVFYYGKLSAIVTVEAIDVNMLEFPPSYVTVSVDKNKTAAVIESLDNGTADYAQVLNKVAFTGDSQIKALTSYEILPQDQVVAKVGESFDYFDANVDNIIAMCRDKEFLVVHYGINTMPVSDEVRDRQIERYKNILIRLQNALPNVRIIISGVFPVSTGIYFNQQRYSYITQFDRALFGMCTELGIDYLSDNQYMTEHQEVFGNDGLHLTPEFYRNYWLRNLIETMGIY